MILNYVVPPDLLAPLVPKGTTLDLWEGQAMLSLVGFRFENTRVLGLAIPGHTNFEEVNLRFYVRRDEPTGSRRAVVFIRELVPRRVIALAARATYNEPYRALPMRHRGGLSKASASVSYEWKEGSSWVGMSAAVNGAAQQLEPGSKAEFITEHYWGYTTQRDGGTLEYRVTHPRWLVWERPHVSTYGDLSQTYGEAFGAVLAGEPESAQVALGSAVQVFRPTRIA